MRAFSEFVARLAIDDWRYFLAQERGIEIAVKLPLVYFQDPASVVRLWRSMPDHPAFEGLVIQLDAVEVVDNLDFVRPLVRQLRFGNIGVAIDGLGWEWSSVIGLRDIPLVEIKVHPEIITGCANDRSKASACLEILEFAGDLGTRTVAAGVETPADFDAVCDMGFDLVQGSLFARPMTAQKFVRTMLRRHASTPR